jgi:hypothetical protein
MTLTAQLMSPTIAALDGAFEFNVNGTKIMTYNKPVRLSVKK